MVIWRFEKIISVCELKGVIESLGRSFNQIYGCLNLCSAFLIFLGGNFRSRDTIKASVAPFLLHSLRNPCLSLRRENKKERTKRKFLKISMEISMFSSSLACNLRQIPLSHIRGSEPNAFPANRSVFRQNSARIRVCFLQFSIICHFCLIETRS